MADAITVLIADDHPLMRQGIRSVLERSGSIDVVHESDNGENALEAIRRLRPAVAVVDVEMPKVDGFGVVRQVEREGLGTSVVFLTMYRDELVFNKALDAGARGYVLKENAAEDIIHAVRAVSNGTYYVSPTISEFLIRRSGRSGDTRQDRIDELTPAERNVLRLLAEMKTSQQIAEELGISAKTVSNHRNNASEKLGLRGAHALLRFALEHRGDL
jgi:DNA-binding NarL/FixJ family response regulator